MQFVVEDGTGLTDATSYVSVAEADDYLSLMSQNSTAWLALSQQDKESYLMLAAKIMDASIKFVGNRAHANSGLRWPRFYAKDCDKIQYEKNEIPQAIKDVNCLIADYYANNTSLQYNAPLADEAGLEKLRVAEITLVWRDDMPNPGEYNKYPWFIRNFLSCLGSIKWASGAARPGSKFKDICCL
jgi:hypothetical protein